MIDKIYELIMKQFNEVMGKDPEYYSKYKVYVSIEQQYVTPDKREKGAIYIVIKYLPASLNYGQVVLPITINALAENNKIEVCQKLLLEFAQTYNLTQNEDNTILQTYTSPANASNFNEVYDGFRSLFYMSGTYLISENANTFKVYVTGESEEVPCLSTGLNFDIQLDTQGTFKSDNFTKSVGLLGTYTMTFACYLTNTPLLNKTLAISLKDLEKEPDGVNTTFYFDLVFKNGLSIKNVAFKLVNLSIQRNVSEMPIVSMTFTN